jgi:hypothetical protein
VGHSRLKTGLGDPGIGREKMDKPIEFSDCLAIRPRIEARLGVRILAVRIDGQLGSTVAGIGKQHHAHTSEHHQKSEGGLKYHGASHRMSMQPEIVVLNRVLAANAMAGQC